MKRTTSIVLAGLFAAVLGLAQDDLHHHNAHFGVGAAIPVGNSTRFLSTAPMIDFGYGYRFNRFFQADAGVQMMFGAANNQNAEITNVGAIQGGDHEFMIPLGGRFYIPQPVKRLDFSIGAGTAYLHYSETVSSNAGGYGGYGYGGYQVGCYSCTSRGGWGGYGLANVSYYLDSGRMYHVGTTLQYVVASTNGGAVANFPPLKTTDHWTNIAFEFGVSF